jgi:hypothetical protein
MVKHYINLDVKVTLRHILLNKMVHAVGQLIEALRYKAEVRGFDSLCGH